MTEDILARDALRALMRWYSEHAYAAGWMQSLAWHIQQDMRSDPTDPIMQVFALLHAEAGGWWSWDVSVPNGSDGLCLRFVRGEAVIHG